jgi:hypothetical protein
MRERDQIVSAAQQLQAELQAAAAAAAEGRAAAAAADGAKREAEALRQEAGTLVEVGAARRAQAPAQTPDHIRTGPRGLLLAWASRSRLHPVFSAAPRPALSERRRTSPVCLKRPDPNPVRAQARRAAEQELAEERAARAAAEEARARAEGERSRLQRARDDLAAALRVAEQRAEEAVEEQASRRALPRVAAHTLHGGAKLDFAAFSGPC